MKNLFYFFSLSISLLLMSCRTEMPTPTPVPTPTPTETYPKLIWSVKTPSEVSGLVWTRPIIYNGLVISDQDCDNAPTKKQQLWGYDKMTGQLVWERYFSEKGYFRNNYKYNNLAVYTTSRFSACVNLENGNTQWEKNLDQDVSGGYYINGFGTNVFQGISYGGSPTNDSSSILRYDLMTGNSQKLFSIQRVGNYCPGIATIIMWIDSNKDSILFFQNRGLYDEPGFKERVDLYAYNLSQKKIVWKIENIEDGSSLHSTPTIYKNRLYFAGMRNIYCINQQTGAVQWKWKSAEANGHLAIGSWEFYENKIFIKPGSKFIYAIDTETGAEVWARATPSLGEQYKNFVVYKGILYATSYSKTRLLAINPNTGEELWSFGKGIFDSAFEFSIDPDTGYFYMHDGIKLHCYQLAAK